VKLGPSSRTATGQTITFPARTFRTLRVTIANTNVGNLVTNPSRLAQVDSGLSSVGLAEVHIAQASGLPASEVINLPTDVVNATATATLDNRLVIVLTRERVAPFPPRSDPEPSMTRSFVLPATRTFSLTGTARINALIPDDLIEHLVGQDQIVAYSSGRLPGDLQAGAESAIDGNPSTVWSPGFGASSQVGSWLRVNLSHPMTINHLNLQIEADSVHSVPTKLTLTSTSGSLFVAGHGRDRRVAQALVGNRQQHRRISPTGFQGLQRRCHVGAVAVLFRAFAGLKPAGSGHVQGVRFGGAGEQLGQRVELDRIGVFFDVVLAGDRPHHLRSALVCLVDHRVHLAGQFQIDCHD